MTIERSGPRSAPVHPWSQFTSATRLTGVGLLPLRAARLAAVRAAWREKQRLSDEWIKTVPKTDYAAIVEGLRALAGKRP